MTSVKRHLNDTPFPAINTSLMRKKIPVGSVFFAFSDISTKIGKTSLPALRKTHRKSTEIPQEFQSKPCAGASADETRKKQGRFLEKDWKLWEVTKNIWKNRKNDESKKVKKDSIRR